MDCWWPLKNLLHPPFWGYSFGVSHRVGCVPRNPFEEEKGFTLHSREMSWEKPSQIPIMISTNCSLRHRTTVKALGSLESGFSLSVGSKSRLDEDCTGTILSQTNTCLCLDLAAGRAGVFRQRTLLGSWTMSPGSPRLLLLFTSRPINS